MRNGCFRRLFVFCVHFFHILIFTCYCSIILHASYSLSQIVKSSDTHGNFESGANFRHVSLLRSRLGCSHATGSLRDSGPSGCSWGDSYVKGVGMLIVSPRGVNFGFWSHQEPMVSFRVFWAKRHYI